MCRDFAAPLKVVVAYEDLRAGRRALGILGRLLDAGSERHLFPEVWRFGLLDDPDWREQATLDAMNADLLILSTSKSGAVPAVVENWISALLTRGHGTTIVILGLFGANETWSISIQESNGARTDPLSINELISRCALSGHNRHFTLV